VKELSKSRQNKVNVIEMKCSALRWRLIPQQKHANEISGLHRQKFQEAAHEGLIDDDS